VLIQLLRSSMQCRNDRALHSSSSSSAKITYTVGVALFRRSQRDCVALSIFHTLPHFRVYADLRRTAPLFSLFLKKLRIDLSTFPSINVRNNRVLVQPTFLPPSTVAHLFCLSYQRTVFSTGHLTVRKVDV